MNYINQAYHAAQDYYNKLPHNTGKMMLYGFGIAGALTAIITQDPRKAIASGAFAALATAIHACTGPIFQKLSKSPRGTLSFPAEWGRRVIAVVTTGFIAQALGHTRIINILGSLILINGLCTYLDGKKGQNIHRATFIIT